MVSDDGIILASVGMSEVYREHEMNLSCDHATEFLLAALAQDRLARFEPKAKVVAPTNHPNIAIIYGLKITATNARASSEEESHETTSMDNLVTYCGFWGPS